MRSISFVAAITTFVATPDEDASICSRSVGKACLLTAVVGGLLALSAGPALASHVSCGATITSDVKLDADLTNCPGDGLVIGADKITVDLNGHTIDGDATAPTECDRDAALDRDAVLDEGIDDSAGHQGLRIRHGSVQEFDVGISTRGVSDSYLSKLTARSNRIGGIDISGGPDDNHDNAIEHNVAAGNGCFGIRLTYAHSTRLVRNRVEDSGFLGGVALVLSKHNVVRNNSVSGSADEAIFLLWSANNQIDHNSLTRRNGVGIRLLQSTDNHITKNTSVENGSAVVLDSDADDNEVTGNDSLRDGDGIVVLGANRNTIIDNHVADTLGVPEFPAESGFGVAIDGGDENVVSDNKLVGTHLDGIGVIAIDPDATGPAVGNIVRKNRITYAGQSGVIVYDSATDSVLTRNTAIGAAHDGIAVHNAATKLTKNIANHNADLGINAVPGVTDGGGNKASANGNPLQCINVLCR